MMHFPAFLSRGSNSHWVFKQPQPLPYGPGPFHMSFSPSLLPTWHLEWVTSAGVRCWSPHLSFVLDFGPAHRFRGRKRRRQRGRHVCVLFLCTELLEDPRKFIVSWSKPVLRLQLRFQQRRQRIGPKKVYSEKEVKREGGVRIVGGKIYVQTSCRFLVDWRSELELIGSDLN